MDSIACHLQVMVMQTLCIIITHAKLQNMFVVVVMVFVVVVNSLLNHHKAGNHSMFVFIRWRIYHIWVAGGTRSNSSITCSSSPLMHSTWSPWLPIFKSLTIILPLLTIFNSPHMVTHSRPWYPLSPSLTLMITSIIPLSPGEHRGPSGPLSLLLSEHLHLLCSGHLPVCCHLLLPSPLCGIS